MADAARSARFKLRPDRNDAPSHRRRLDQARRRIFHRPILRLLELEQGVDGKRVAEKQLGRANRVLADPGNDQLPGGFRQICRRLPVDRQVVTDALIFKPATGLAFHSIELVSQIFEARGRPDLKRPRGVPTYGNVLRIPRIARRIEAEIQYRAEQTVYPIESQGQPDRALAQFFHGATAKGVQTSSQSA